MFFSGFASSQSDQSPCCLHRKTRLHEELGGSVVDFLYEIAGAEGLRVPASPEALCCVLQ